MTPTRKGFAYAVGLVAGMTVIFPMAFVLWSVPPASAGLFRQLGQAGIGLLIAYSVVVAAGEKILSDRGTRDGHQGWLGFVVGLGVCGLIGVGLAFGLAEHRAAGHENLVDWLGLWWVVSSVGFLGLIVALQPWMTHEWRKLPTKHRWRVTRLRSEGSRSRVPGA